MTKTSIVPQDAPTLASDAELTAHEADTTSVHGIANTANLSTTSHVHAGADITSGTVADARIDAALARDTEVTTAVSDHAAAADPHTDYLKESDANYIDLTDGGATTLHSHALTGAPADADYLVGTAHAGLSAEIVVGATPGGELGNTWASPTVDASHSGSTHAATQAAAEATAAGALTTHEGAADPHTGYRLESADHSHATTGLQAGTVAHTALTSVGANDHHAQLHAAAHATGQPDVIAPADIGASATGHTHTHAATTGQGVDDHHARDHAVNGATHTGTLDDAQIPAGIARDAEVAAAYQPLDSDLTAIAALTTTAFGRGLLALADAAALGANHSHSGAAYAPGSFTVATGNYALMSNHLQLTTTQRVTLTGTARLRIT